MCPASLRTSQSARSLQAETKFWLLLVGVNHYHDAQLPDLRYSMMDCQGLSEALSEATRAIAQKDISVYHDGTAQPPTLATVQASLKNMVANARPQDTILLYFSGHGLQDPQSQQAILCLADTQKDCLLETGLSLQKILQDFSRCAARQQLVWLDACHSGGMTLRGAQDQATALPNPMPQMVSALRQQAAQSSGFYALLSCDQDQRSWEFPQLGHGVFTYYLMEGLRGNAANAQGAIEADSLYRYVYYQTLQYIDKANQQLRLINQQKRRRGDTQLRSEYPLQTPKRIVEGIGEITLALTVSETKPKASRQALLIDDLPDTSTRLALGKVLRQAGDFDLSYWPQPGHKSLNVRAAIAQTLKTEVSTKFPTESSTALLYLRGNLKHTEAGDAVLTLPDGTQISRSWLRQVLRRSAIAQQIIIFDCPGASDLPEWVEDLQTAEQGQCLLAAAAPISAPNAFAQALLDTLTAVDQQIGLPAAGWITQLQGRLALAAISSSFWLSGKGIIDVLPARRGKQPGEAAPFDMGLCPYRGLQAFREDDAAFFFGRAALVQRLLQVLNQQTFLAVVGASGSGKSSVVQAGLVAQLRQGKQIPGSQTWWVRSLRPGSHPLRVLAQKLTESGSEKEQLQTEGLLHLGVEGFVRWLRSRPEPMVVLVLDQFEELFSLASEQARREFLDLVLGAIAHAGDRFKLVITLRADFMSACLEVPALAQKLQRASVLVPPVLSEADYRQIILRPAEKVGLAVEPELVNVLLQDINQGVGDLPLLEFVLEQIWEQRQPGQLTLQVYQEQVGGLKGALERKAQAAYEALDKSAQNCARWIFLNLTQLGEGTEDTRRQVAKSDLVVAKYPEALVEETLGALTAAKLVVVGVEEGFGESRGEGESGRGGAELVGSTEVTVEVAHEILIRHWSTLRWWLEENRTRLRSQRQVEQAAAAWMQSGQQSDFLLRGVPLDAAVEIYVNYTDELSREVQAFVEAGLSAREAEQQKTQKQLRRARRAIALISTLAVGVAGFGGTTYWQQQQARLREVETLNALSTAQLSNNQSLEAMVSAVKAGQQLQSIPLKLFNRQAAPVRAQTIGTLQQAITLSAERNRLVGHSEQVNAVAYSPDGQLLASVSDDGTLKIWRADGTLIKSVVVSQSSDPNLNSRLLAVAFSPNSQQIAVAQSNGEVTIWSQPADALQRKIAAHSDWVTALAFSPNGKTLATASRDGQVKLWQAANGKLRSTLSLHSGWVNAISWSPDSQQLASGGEDQQIGLWDVESGQLIWTVVGHSERVTSLDVSPDGDWLLSGGGDRTIKRWPLPASTQSPEPQILGEHDDQITAVAFSPTGESVISTGADRQVRLWQGEGNAPIASWKGHGGSVLSATWSPDGRSVASASTDKTIRLWEVPEAEDSTPELYAVQLSLEAKTLAGVSWDGDIELWERQENGLGGRLRTLPTRDSYVFQVAFGSGLLAAASEDGSVRLWNLTDGQLTGRLTGHAGAVKGIAFSPDRKQLLSGGVDGTVRLWNPTAGTAVKHWTAHMGEVRAIAWHPNSRLIASGSDDRTVKIWDVNGNLKQELAGHSEAIAALTFSPDKRILASSAWDNTIKIWRVRDGALLHTLSGHQNGVTELVFTPNGQVLISGSADSTLKVWNPQTGDLLKTLLGPQNAVESLGIGADGRLLVSSGDSLEMYLWNWNLNDLLEEGCVHLADYAKNSSSTLDRQFCQKS